MNKQDVFDSIEDRTYKPGEVRHLIHSITNKELLKPSHLKRGDIIIQAIGMKARPCIIIKVLKDSVWFVPLSTANDHMKLMDCTSRFYSTSHFTRCISSTTTDLALEYFCGVYDNSSDITKVTKLLKKYFNL